MFMRPAALLALAISGIWASSGTAQNAIGMEPEEAFGMQLIEELVLGEESGISFGTLLHLDVDSRGNIFVGDWMSSTVTVFSVDGELRQELGRAGGGPGEFRGIHQVLIGRQDTLYVFDASAGRITAYAPGEEYSLAYTVPIHSPASVGRPYRLFVPGDASQDFYVAFRRQALGMMSVHRVSESGETSERTVLEGRSGEVVARVGQQGSATAVTRTAPLFGRRGVVGMTHSDELYYTWTDEIDVNFFDLTGKWVRMYRASTAPLPVTPRDIEHELKDASQMRLEALEGAEHPDFKPALHSLLIDDRSWIWTARYTGDPTLLEWWIHPAGGEHRSGIITLPSHVHIRAVRNGKAYAASVDEVGFPVVIRFGIAAGGGGSP